MQTQALMTMTSAATMSSREIAELVESRHDDVKRSIARLADRGVIQLPPMAEVKNHLGQTVTEYRIGKRDSYVIVAQLSPEFTARLVDRWQELEAGVAPAIPSPASKLIGELAVLECFTRLLRPSPSSQVAMLAHISKNNGLSFNYLPAYVEDTAPDAIGGGSLTTRPLTALLKLHGIKFTPQTYNGLLCDAGMLEHRTRKSTSPKASGGIKRFWAISEKGLRYGKNITNPNSPRETQPHWYESRFAELHEVISQYVRGD
jgi:hypothetical protein